MNELQRELEAFKANVNALARIEHKPAPEPVRQLSFEDILNKSDLSVADDENRSTLRRLAKKSALFEITPMFYGWVESLKSDPWNLEFDDDQLKRLVAASIKLMDERGLSPLSPKSYDYCRRTFSRMGLLPEGMFTEDEALVERLNNTPEMGFAQRREFASELRRIRESS